MPINLVSRNHQFLTEVNKRNKAEADLLWLHIHKYRSGLKSSTDLL